VDKLALARGVMLARRNHAPAAVAGALTPAPGRSQCSAGFVTYSASEVEMPAYRWRRWSAAGRSALKRRGNGRLARWGSRADWSIAVTGVAGPDEALHRNR
jgi:hypothetical protein